MQHLRTPMGFGNFPAARLWARVPILSRSSAIRKLTRVSPKQLESSCVTTLPVIPAAESMSGEAPSGGSLRPPSHLI